MSNKKFDRKLSEIKDSERNTSLKKEVKENSNETKPFITKTHVKCIRCGHEWDYTKGIPHYRIHCPDCGSTQNELNRKVFGKWCEEKIFHAIA